MKRLFKLSPEEGLKHSGGRVGHQDCFVALTRQHEQAHLGVGRQGRLDIEDEHLASGFSDATK